MVGVGSFIMGLRTWDRGRKGHLQGELVDKTCLLIFSGKFPFSQAIFPTSDTGKETGLGRKGALPVSIAHHLFLSIFLYA